jgi:hypothetical protein
MIVYYFLFLRTKTVHFDSMLSSFKIKQFALLHYCLVLVQPRLFFFGNVIL